VNAGGGRVRSPLDQAAWNEFVERYGRRIYGWCRQWGLQEADAEDVTQDVLLRLARKMQVATVFVARSKVQKMLQDEARRLDSANGA
jgi:DNA-directed RNA polymerase specialized sigma24 family protein